MRLNNIKSLIERFLDTYCTKVKEDEESAYVELMMDDHRCIFYYVNNIIFPKIVL